MSLRDRLTRRQNGAAAPATAPAELAGEARPPATPRAPSVAATSGMYGRRAEVVPISPIEQVKMDLHRKLIERLDLEALEQIPDERLLNSEIRAVVIELLREESTPLTVADREDIIEQVLYEITGLGPIEPLFRDLSISDILVNGSKEIYIERGGRLTRVAASFRNDAHLLAVIDRIVSRVGRRVDESSPMVDARLPDGSRVNAIIPPLALDGPVLSIRRFGIDLSIQKLIDNGTLNTEMASLVAGCVAARLNILVSGGTGAGKTTLLNAMASFVPPDQRIITIEDAAELRLQQEHVVRLETRPPNAEGEGEVKARDLVKNALRMRPDRIIVGEVRSGEALDMLQAMNTGHEGSLTTIHANSPRDALARLETMILMAGANLPDKAMREQISSALDLIIQITRLSDGTRRITSMVEVTGMEGPVTATQEIFRYRRKGVSPAGEVIGEFEATGVRPTFMERLRVAGIEVSNDLFAEGVLR
ncbi:MAG: CpaF family protein [Gemmatimonadaceae bacterium]|nr:CpaF family protein [Gemmatimonadaceae bacterium]